jgi:uncharacterized protein (TIGR02145 family)
MDYGSSSSGLEMGIFTDSRDYQPYKWVKIGEQTWMARNLNLVKDENGNDIGGRCYDDDPKNCGSYGRLYDWATAMALPPSYNLSSYTLSAKHKGVCPSGWHIPTEVEWTTLIDYVENSNGCSNCAWKHLKSASGWSSYGGLDTYEFNALPGGLGANSDFGGSGDLGLWWSANNYNNNAYPYMLDSENFGLFAHDKSLLLSVRCLME